MARILFAWELGANLGHVTQLAPVARCLEEEGHELLFAVRDMAAAAQVLRGKRVRIVQAPVGRSPKARDVPISYAEMLGNVGYTGAEAIGALLRGWLELFRLFDPEIVVADHAPTALLAGRIAGLPRADIASGFTRPPRIDPLPSMQPWRDIPVEQLARVEAEMLGRVNAALRSHRAAPLGRLADLFDVEASFLATFAELDHYDGRKGEQYWGPLLPESMGLKRDWPTGERPKILAYLRAPTMIAPTLNSIAASGAAAICYVPSADPSLIESCATKGIEIHRSPLAIDHLLQEADLTVSHGGHGFVCASLLAGVPCVVLPTNIEQALTARNVARTGAGVASRFAQAERGDPIGRALNDTAARHRARSFQRKFAERRPDGPALDIARAITGLVSVKLRSSS